MHQPKPGTGTYVIDMGDPAASNTWPPTRMEFNMKDQMIRNTILDTQKDVEEIKKSLEKIEDKLYNR